MCNKCTELQLDEEQWTAVHGRRSLGAAQPVEVRKLHLARYLMAGYNIKESAAKVGVSYLTARNYLKDPTLRELLQQKHSGILEQLDSTITQRYLDKTARIDDMAYEALDVMEEMLQASDNRLRLKAAQDVLDRDPSTSRQKKLDITERRLELTGEDLLRAVEVAREVSQGRQLEQAREDDNSNTAA